MLINKITNKNKPYIVALNIKNKDSYKEYSMTVKDYRFNSDAMNNKCMFFASKEYKKDFNNNTIGIYDKYLLCCKDKQNIYIWNNIRIEQLQNNKGFYAITENIEAERKEIKENISKIINNNYDNATVLSIKLITSMILFIFTCSLMVIHSDYSIKNALHKNSTNQSAVAGVMDTANYINIDNNIPATNLDDYGDAKSDLTNDRDDTNINTAEIEDNKNNTSEDYTYVSDTYNGKSITYITLDNDIYKPELVASDSYSSVATLVKNNGGTIGINASAWSEDGSLDMTYINGSWISDNNDSYVGDPLVFASGTLSAFGYDFTSKELIERANPDWVCTGFNAVIYSTYSTNTDWNEKYDRSFIGQLSNGDYIIGVIE